MSKKLHPHYMAAGGQKIIREVIMKINASKITILITVAFVFSLFTIRQVDAQGSGWNTTSINVTDFSFTPSTIDSTNGSQTITMTIHVTDTERDFWSGYVLFRSPQTRIQHDFGGFGIQDRISGNGRDGVYRKTVTIHQFAEVGAWEVSEIFIYDGTLSYYRWRSFYTTDLVARGFPTQLQVINNNEAVPPEISDFNFTPSTVSGFRTVTVTLRARDETSGIRSIYVNFTNPPGCYYYDDECGTLFDPFTTSAVRISGDERDGVYRVVANVPQYVSAGTFYASVSATDAVLNRSRLSSDDLAARGYPSQLRVFEAFVGISGRVTTPDGRGLRNAVVSLIDSTSTASTATTSSFGNFSFNNAPTGETYTIAVTSKRYRFTSRQLIVNNTLTNVDFVGQE